MRGHTGGDDAFGDVESLDSLERVTAACFPVGRDLSGRDSDIEFALGEAVHLLQ